MIYRVYTDAATKIKDGYSSVAYLILQGNTYIKMHNEQRTVANTSIAESIAVSLALEYLVNELDITETDEVILFCDSLYTVKFAKKCLKQHKAGEDADKICSRPKKAYWLASIYDNIPKIKGKLIITKIRAHQQGKNPHCYVDRLAKSGLVIN